MEFDGCHGNFKIDGHMSDASKFPQRMKDQVLRVNCLFTTMKKPYWGGGGVASTFMFPEPIIISQGGSQDMYM